MVNTDETQVAPGSRSLARKQYSSKRSEFFYNLRRFAVSQSQGGPGRRGKKGEGTRPPRSRWAREDSGGVPGSRLVRFRFRAESGGVPGSRLVRFGFRAGTCGVSGPSPGRHTGRSQSGVGDPSGLAGCLAGPRRQTSVGRVHQSGAFARGTTGIPSRAFAKLAPPYAPGASRRGKPGSGPGRRGHAGACGAWRCGCYA